MKKLFLPLFLVFAMVGTASAQTGLDVITGNSAADAAIDVLTTVINPLTVEGTRALDFGNVLPGVGDVVVAAAADGGGGLQSGQFTIAGQRGFTVSISGSAGNFPAGSGISWTANLPTTSEQLTGGTGALGTVEVYLGGTLSVPATATPGAYSTDYTLTVEYVSI